MSKVSATTRVGQSPSIVPQGQRSSWELTLPQPNYKVCELSGPGAAPAHGNGLQGARTEPLFSKVFSQLELILKFSFFFEFLKMGPDAELSAKHTLLLKHLFLSHFYHALMHNLFPRSP